MHRSWLRYFVYSCVCLKISAINVKKIQHCFECQNGKQLLTYFFPSWRECSTFFEHIKQFSFPGVIRISSFIFFSKGCVYKQTQLVTFRFRIYLGLWFPRRCRENDKVRKPQWEIGKARSRREALGTEYSGAQSMSCLSEGIADTSQGWVRLLTRALPKHLGPIKHQI